MLAMHLLFLWSVRGRIARGDPDFTAFYTAGTLLRSGQGSLIYDPAAQFTAQSRFAGDSDIRRGPLRYIHPPWEAILFIPFTLLSYPVAFALWDLANLGMLVAAAGILRAALLSDWRIRTWELLAALLAFFPVFANFFQGQDAILLLLLVALAFRSIHLRADFVAGCWLALGLFRFQLVIPFVLVLVVWRGRRLASGFGVASAVLVLISAALVGWGTMLQYPGYLWLWTSVPGFGRTPPSLLPNLFGLVTGWPRLDRVHWLPVLVLIASAGLLVLIARMKNLAQQSDSFNLCVACAILASVLVGYNTSTYDLALLAIPLAIMLRYQLDGRMRRTLLLPIVPLLISPLWFLIGMYWHNFNLVAIFLVWWLFAIRSELIRRRANPVASGVMSPLA